jgi:hypothetical protein
MTTQALGREGFNWFIGVVEDREDPLKLGRVRVRIYDIHNENKGIQPTDGLPWATIMVPPTSASHQRVGITPVGLLVGSTVVGFFMDGNDCNQPVIMGTIYGIPGNKEENHEVAKEAREINEVKKDYEYDEDEPESPYGTKYPYNKVFTTEGGHVVEFDDTPGNERIHIFHTSGTYSEVNNEGRRVDKTVGDHYEIVLKDQTIHILGNQAVHINGDVDILVDGNYTLNVVKDIVINGKTINMNYGTMGAARIGDTADTGDDGTGGHFDTNSPGTNIIETGSGTVFIGD